MRQPCEKMERNGERVDGWKVVRLAGRLAGHDHNRDAAFGDDCMMEVAQQVSRSGPPLLEQELVVRPGAVNRCRGQEERA